MAGGGRGAAVLASVLARPPLGRKLACVAGSRVERAVA